MSIYLKEKETMINFSEYENEATVHTRSKTIIDRFEVLCSEYPEQFRCIEFDSSYKTYIISKEYILFRSLI